jgi:hypothetical protein
MHSAAALIQVHGFVSSVCDAAQKTRWYSRVCALRFRICEFANTSTSWSTILHARVIALRRWTQIACSRAVRRARLFARRAETRGYRLVIGCTPAFMLRSQ